MRRITLLLVVLFSAACSKDDFNPSNPKNGQKAELFVDHYSDVRDQMIFLLPNKSASPLSLGGFEERELGYTYKVKAKVYVSPQPIMDDGANSWFEYTEVISKEKYTGTDPFEIGLVHPMGWQSGGGLAVKKEGDQYMYGAGGNIRPANPEVKQQLDDLILKEKEVGSVDEYRKYQQYMNKLALRAVVTHDPENWGKGYLVHGFKSSDTQ